MSVSSALIEATAFIQQICNSQNLPLFSHINIRQSLFVSDDIPCFSFGIVMDKKEMAFPSFASAYLNLSPQESLILERYIFREVRNYLEPFDNIYDSMQYIKESFIANTESNRYFDLSNQYFSIYPKRYPDIISFFDDNTSFCHRLPALLTQLGSPFSQNLKTELQSIFERTLFHQSLSYQKSNLSIDPPKSSRRI